MAVLGGVLVLASGCASSTTAGSPAVVATTAGPKASPVPARVIAIATPRAQSAAPGLKNTGAAWPAILASLAGYGQWLLANPDPAKIATIAEPGCGEANLLSTQVTGLLGSNLYVQPSPVVFTTVNGPSPVAAGVDSVTLDVTASRPTEPVLDRKRKQVTTFEALPQTSLQITLNRGSDQKWRLCTVDAMTDAGAPDDPSVALL
jgi:hypothetical protein